MSKLFYIEGTFNGSIYADSEEDAEINFSELDIDDFNITSVESAEEN